MSLIIYLAEIKMLIRMRNSFDHDVRFKMETVKFQHSLKFFKRSRDILFGNNGRKSAKGKTFWNSTYF